MTIHAATHRNGIRGGHGTQPAQIARYGLRGRGRGLYRRYLSGLGTVTAANTGTVRSRVDGQLISLHFQEGPQVNAGDLLAHIDPSQFKGALAQAPGDLAQVKAQLANA
ncbi:biotin/lipoyl-binding protein, partial [Salmonella enterica subsp. enterica serovar Newport]|nr:biotin/lipoyl-binding protein [Salmonella enterica subsp. enterica serovar Newport]